MRGIKTRPRKRPPDPTPDEIEERKREVWAMREERDLETTLWEEERRTLAAIAVIWGKDWR